MRLSVVLAVAIAIGIIGSACDSSVESPRDLGGSTATLSPTPTESPTATPAPSCVGLSQDVGFRVRLGRIGNRPCVIWDEAPGGAPYQVLVEAGKFEPSATPTGQGRLTALSSPFDVPSDVMPPFRPDQPCLSGDDTRFMVSVFASDGSKLGGESWMTCVRKPVFPDGCPGPEPGNGAEIGRNDDGLVCITWPDRQDDETGFGIKLEYGSGEFFEYNVPPNTNEFLPPRADTAGLGALDLTTGRKDFGVQVWAIRPDGETPVGSTFVQVQ